MVTLYSIYLFLAFLKEVTSKKVSSLKAIKHNKCRSLPMNPVETLENLLDDILRCGDIWHKARTNHSRQVRDTELCHQEELELAI